MGGEGAGLRLVHSTTGEISEDPEHVCLDCRDYLDVIAGLQRDIAGWTMRYANLQRDLEAEAKGDPLWPVGELIFGYWREQCKHPRSRYSFSDFELVRPHLKRRGFGPEMCLRAVAGGGFDARTTTRRNGSTKRHDGWELIFRDRDHAEEFVNRAPKDWTAPAELLLALAEAIS